MHLFGKNHLSCRQPGCALKFFTFIDFTKHLRIAHSDFNLLHTANCVKSNNNLSIRCKNKNNNINIQCKNENVCSNTVQENCEMDVALVSQTPITNEVKYTTDLILTSAKLQSIAYNYASQLTALGMTDNAINSVINASAELITKMPIV